MSIYEERLPKVKAERDDQELPFDCNHCHRLFTVGELKALVMPFANRGEQSGEIECPKCHGRTKVQFAGDSIQ